MSNEKKPAGTIGWIDLTVPGAEDVRAFYESVVGWTSTPVDMGGYSDHCMNAADGKTVAGVCHSRGMNANMPPQWMIYIVVDDLEKSLAACTAGGGEVVLRRDGNNGFAVIRDPAGALAAIGEF